MLKYTAEVKICLAHSENENLHLGSRQATNRFIFFFFFTIEKTQLLTCRAIYSA